MTRWCECIAILAALLAALVLCLLWLNASSQGWRAYQAERILSRGGHLPAATLTAVLEESKSLPEAFFPSRFMDIPAFLAAALAGREQGHTGEKREQVLEGVHLARLALARDPSDTHAWAIFALLSQLAHGPSAQVVDALQLSVCTGPANRKLIFWRLGMAALNHGYWTMEFVDYIRRQILLAYDISPRKLAETAQIYGFLPLVQVVLIMEPEKFHELEGYVKERPQHPDRAKLPGT